MFDKKFSKFDIIDHFSDYSFGEGLGSGSGYGKGSGVVYFILAPSIDHYIRTIFISEFSEEIYFDEE